MFEKNASQSISEQLIEPVVRELPADLETPVSVYLKLAGRGPPSCSKASPAASRWRATRLSASAPAGPTSCAGIQSSAGRGWRDAGSRWPRQDPLDVLRAEMDRYRTAPVPGLPRFAGGLVGYLGYEMVRFFEPSVEIAPHAELPDAIFLLADTVVAFDHAFGRLLLIANVYPGR